MYPLERSLVEDMAGRPFRLLGVNNDKKKKVALEAVEKNGLNWRSWWDGGNNAICKKFKIAGFPTIFLVDHRGVIRANELRGEGLNGAIELLVAEAEADFASGTPRFPIREFSDKTGKYKVSARLVRVDADAIVLEKESGGEITVEVSKLSRKDQAYVRAHTAPK
jgi:hypothetical protein